MKHLPSDERGAAARRLVVEENAIRGMHAICLTVVDNDPIGIQLGHGIWGARIKWSRLPLRNLL